MTNGEENEEKIPKQKYGKIKTQSKDPRMFSIVLSIIISITQRVDVLNIYFIYIYIYQVWYVGKNLTADIYLKNSHYTVDNACILDYHSLFTLSLSPCCLLRDT